MKTVPRRPLSRRAVTLCVVLLTSLACTPAPALEPSPDAGSALSGGQGGGGALAGGDGQVGGSAGGTTAGGDAGLAGGRGGGDAAAGFATTFGLGAEKRVDDVRVPIDQTTAPACSAGLTTACLYQPPLATSVTEWVFKDDVSYVDVLGRQRQVAFAVYRASSAPPAAPVIIMSHGGSHGINDPTEAMREWASILSGAGYVVVSIAHSDYSMASAGGAPSDYEQLCDAVGVPRVPGFTCALKVSWQRPLDVEAVLGWLEHRVATNASWATAVNIDRVAHFGHSAGAGAGMMVGGITRNFRCAQPFGDGQGTLVPCLVSDLVSRRLAQVRAIVAFSPEGPGTEGFMTESFGALQVPMLMATGLEDGDPGEPAVRASLFDLLPTGPRWEVYIDDSGAQHGLFGGNLDPCLNATTPQRCADFRGALTASALAFLDAQLKGRAAGTAWLGSGNLPMLHPGVVTLRAR